MQHSDSLNTILFRKVSQIITSHTSSLCLREAVFSVDNHFGCSRAQPFAYVYCSHHSPVLLTKSMGQQTCTNSAPFLTLLDKSSITLHDALYYPEAFWALPFYTPEELSVNFAWTYAVQHLLRLTGSTVSLYDVAESEIFLKSNHCCSNKEQWLVVNNLLNGANCFRLSFYDCACFIIEMLHSNNLLTDRFAQQIQLFIHTINEFKLLPTFSERKLKCDDLNVVKYSPNFIEEKDNLKLSVQTMQDTCQFFSEQTGKITLSKPWIQYKDILLIIIFNNPMYNVIPYLELLYRSFFPNIVYCGPGYKEFNNMKSYNFIFVPYENIEGTDAGSFSYICVSKVMSMNFKTDGYLVISDDIVLSPAAIQKYDTDKIWYLPKSSIRIADVNLQRECHLGMCDFHPRWSWWSLYKNQTSRAYSNVLSNFPRCSSNLQQFTGGKSRVCGAYSDVYYIPQRLTEDFQNLAQMFYEKKVFVEISVATILICLQDYEQAESINGHIEWSANRDFPWIFFEKTYLFQKAFLHPVKWGYIEKGSSEYQQLFCEKVLPSLHDKFSEYW